MQFLISMHINPAVRAIELAAQIPDAAIEGLGVRCGR